MMRGRDLKLTDFPDCCKGKILSGLGGETDKTRLESLADVENKLKAARYGRVTNRGFTLTVLTKAQAAHFKDLLQKYGYQRVTAWFNFSAGQVRGDPDNSYYKDPFALFVARHDEKEQPKKNRARGADYE